MAIGPAAALVLAVACGACQFDSGGVGGQAADAAGRNHVGGFDPDDCDPGERACSGHILQTCGEDGTLDSSQDVRCDFTCTDRQCVFASNMLSDVYDSCSPGAPALAPPDGAVVDLTAEPSIRCEPHCGDDQSVIEPISIRPQADDPPLAIFCLSSVEIPASAEIVGARESDASAAIALLVRSRVDIAGEVDLRGGDAGELLGGAGGPGGGTGARLAGTSGRDGTGPCPGEGGARDGRDPDFAAGGGGGGGFGGVGGRGGDGRDSTEARIGEGGDGGDDCAEKQLIPMVGGSGGGGGASGDCGEPCGFAGGGGGGALQISAREAIAVSGHIDASGGGGYGDASGEFARGGGGGGGSGGAVLLEAPVVEISGAIAVEGGDGGAAGAGDGGAGARGNATTGASGTSFRDADQGGAGGGGAGGRVRINDAVGGSDCGDVVSPRLACERKTL